MIEETRKLIMFTLAAVLMLLNTQPMLAQSQTGSGIKIVVTFPFMLRDIENLLCLGDEVYPLVPPGVDPHDYQLTYRDFEILSKSHVIISTAHTPFEMKIREIVLSNEIKAELVEVPNIPNITFLKIPNTNTTNYHGVLYRSDNLVMFINYITKILINLRPECRDEYLNKSRAVIERVEQLGSFKPLKGFKAVVDKPVLQYLASWLGGDVVQVVIVEHDVPVTPNDIEKVEENLRKYGAEAIVIVSEDSTVKNVLEELAIKYRARVIAVPNPVTSTESIAEYLENVYNIVVNQLTVVRQGAPQSEDSRTLLITLAVIVTIVIVLLFALFRGRR